MSPSAPSLTEQAPFIPFPVTVQAVTRLSPSFLRITFGGDELAHFADNGADQRIKLVLPAPRPPEPGEGFDDGLGASADWYRHWLSIPPERRNPLRTYTVRAVRTQQCEVDVDVVLHGDGGPASRWATSAAAGDRIHIIGPNARHEGSTAALGWNPPSSTPFLFIGGDETAVPAIAAILEGLPPNARGRAILEVATAQDVLPLDSPAGVLLEWTTRDGAAHGVRLEPAVRAAAAQVLNDTFALGATSAPESGPDGSHRRDGDPEESPEEELWDVPEPVEAAASYAWLAGEAGCVARLRRHLVRELGFPRRQVAFMGYWRAGAPSE